MKTAYRIAPAWLAGLLAAALSYPGHAVPIIQNGGFEAGFDEWITEDQIGSDGTFFLQTGTSSPVLLFPVPAPPEGIQAAMTDAEGPGSHLLYQDFTVPAVVPLATLSFDLFIGSRAIDGLGNDFPFQTPNTLDFATTELNQQARVDLLAGGTNAFSVDAADVLLNLFQTMPGDPLVSGYTHFTFDVTGLLNANLGAPLRLRFAEVDNVGPFQFGVDNVGLEIGVAQVPEPTSWALAFGALLAMMLARRRSMPIAANGVELR